MEKKGTLDDVDTKSRSRRVTSERKAEQADSKDQNEGAAAGEQPAAKNRRRRTGGDENGWMSSNNAGPGSRHTSAIPVPVEEDEPKDSQAVR
jgi:hypothetical protein